MEKGQILAGLPIPDGVDYRKGTGMGYDPRSIAFITELIHPPVQHNDSALNTVYNGVFKEKGMGYQNFNIIQGGAQISSTPKKGRISSILLFLPDRLRIQEDFPQFALEDFYRKVLKVVEIFLRSVNLPVFALQHVVIRSLITPKKFKDSLAFLSETICGLKKESMTEFRRPHNFFGMRFVFPQTPEKRNTFTVRIEAYPSDSRSILLENTGVFFTPIPRGSQAVIRDNILETYRYLSEEICSFLEAFEL